MSGPLEKAAEVLQKRKVGTYVQPHELATESGLQRSQAVAVLCLAAARGLGDLYVFVYHRHCSQVPITSQKLPRPSGAETDLALICAIGSSYYYAASDAITAQSLLQYKIFDGYPKYPIHCDECETEFEDGADLLFDLALKISEAE